MVRVVDFCYPNFKHVMSNLPGKTNPLEILRSKQPLACIIAIIACMVFVKMAVAVDQGHGFKPFARPPRYKLQSFTQLDFKMLDFSQSKLAQSLKHAFQSTNIYKSFSTPCLPNSSTVEDDFGPNARIEIIGGHNAPRVRSLVVEVAIAIASGVNPEPASNGLGGAYFMRSREGDIIAVAKPMDEEPLAFNNPKCFGGRMLGQPGMKHSIRIGEAGLREAAAYLLDHDGFSGVPPTALVKFSHVRFNMNNVETDLSPPLKFASLQCFVKHHSDAGDLGPSSFSVTSVHHIGILDVRLMNLDRHAGNILVKQEKQNYAGGKAELVPIDHGFCLPESLEDPYFEWLHWPQSSIPFSESELEYISGLDPFKDAELLRTELPLIRESSIRVLVLCTIFLKQATKFGLCLADIGEMMTREFDGGEENWSTLEILCLNAKVNLIDRNCDDNTSDDQNVEEVNEMFQFDDDEVETKDDDLNKDSGIPQMLHKSPQKGKPPPLIPKFSSMSGLDVPSSFHLNKSDDHDKVLEKNTYSDNSSLNGDEDYQQDDNLKSSGLMRSLSCAVPNYSHDVQVISFEEMNEEEWLLFLESFERLLPEAFEGRSMCLSKQRLGSSCEF
ncbi:LOW QUALITY PROTEIN: phosphatidylinositol 4-kinase gamma 8-like [Henckelia pumila]|uniref:LOW QUALITY PROTEIN: phosphatidylinositol 4-kinase gamma 8-like n=1 Tax=Henckelia pumila TaxID=405737 RepID=UPI003C6E549C